MFLSSIGLIALPLSLSALAFPSSLSSSTSTPKTQRQNPSFLTYQRFAVARFWEGLKSRIMRLGPNNNPFTRGWHSLLQRLGGQKWRVFFLDLLKCDLGLLDVVEARDELERILTRGAAFWDTDAVF